jgi:hypothetical protein
MTEKERLRRLEVLNRLFEGGAPYNGFPDELTCIRWANEVKPLLDFDPTYLAKFEEGLNAIQLPISLDAMKIYNNQMVSQLEIAINDLKARKGKTKLSGLSSCITAKNFLILIIILFVSYHIYLGAKVKKIGIPHLFEIELDHKK